jgi:acetyl esterase/lipase
MPAPTVTTKPVVAPSVVRPARTVTYCTPNDSDFSDHTTSLLMDLYLPKTRGPWPVVLRVHGGGWTQGDRTSGGNFEAADLNKIGIAYASVDYRLAPAFKFPTPIQDIACAVRYLRANATQLNIDPKKVGAMGDSAGGQLVSLLATAPAQAGFDVGQYLDQSSRPQVVVDEWGPAEFDDTLAVDIPYLPTVFGTTDLSAMTWYSPIAWVTSSAPPFLIIQGASDKVVEPYQSQDFFNTLQASGVPSTLEMVSNAGHGLVPVGRGFVLPTRVQVRADITAFFQRYLKR